MAVLPGFGTVDVLQFSVYMGKYIYVYNVYFYTCMICVRVALFGNIHFVYIKYILKKTCIYIYIYIRRSCIHVSVYVCNKYISTYSAT